MTVVSHLAVGLVADIRGRDQHTELAVAQTANKPTDLPYPNAIRGCIALRLECKLHVHRVGSWAKRVVSDGIAPSVPGRASDLN